MKKTIKHLSVLCFMIVMTMLFSVGSESFSAGETNASQPIADGIYTIRSSINEKYVLDIVSASKGDGANIQLYEEAKVDQQRFKVTYLGNGYYTIAAVHSNKMLDVANGGMTAGTNLWQYTSNGTDAQKWTIKSAGNGYYYIVSKWNGLYVDVESAVAKNGTNIQMYTGNGSNAQKFKFEAYKTSTNNTGSTTQTPTGTKTIEDGTYTIQSAINTNYVLDVVSGSKGNGANIQLYENANVDQQKFKVKYLGDGYYSITALHSSKVLDVANGGKTPETNLWQYESNGTDAQKWVIKSAGNDSYYLISKWNGLYVDVQSGSAKNGTNVQLYTGNASNAQKFKFKAIQNNNTNNNTGNTTQTPTGTQTVKDGTYTIQSAINTNYVLDISSGSKSNGANVQLYQESNVDQQKFKVKYLGDGYYSITALHSNKVLDVANGGKTAGTNLWQYESNGTDAQKWVIKSAGNDSYYIISKWNGLYVDVQSADAKNGTNIQMYTGNGSNAQKFKFKEIKQPEPLIGTKTIENGTYTIETALSSNYALDVQGGLRGNEANVQIYKKQAVGRQKFKVTYLGDGSYSIVAVHSNKLLDVAYGEKRAGANVWQYENNGSAAQKWIIKEAGNGSYYIISKGTEMYLDVQCGSASNGTNVQIYTGNGSTAQKFKFVTPLNVLDTIDTSKYPGYKEKIAALMDQHPGWNFELLYTGLRFDEVITGETKLHSRNLVPSNYSGSWICSVCGTKLYDSGWYCASASAVAYYMDPRNFLDETNVFQFQDVNEYISGVCTLEGIQTKINGTFLQRYANDINNACRNQNVNPYYIIARLLQEQGANGTTIGKGMNGGDGKTYYNPFNIGASGNGYSTIYANALKTAKSYGWDTMEKAIEGGITFCKKNWLENYQNTLYQNKFDIDTRNGSALYEHQYMQNLMAAYSEARTLKSAYVNTNKLDSNFTFIIPMYEKMSATVSQKPGSSSEISPINVKITANGGLNLRAEANEGSTVLRTIPQNTVLLSVERGINSNWHKVITEDGLIGYMTGQYLTQVADVTNCNYTARVKTNDGSGCYIRIGPSRDLATIIALPEGTSVRVIDKGRYNNITGYDWCRIQLSDGQQAFMPIRFLQ